MVLSVPTPILAAEQIDIIEDTNADFENSDESENLIVTSDGENFEIVDESAELDLPMENTENLNSTEDDSIELFDDGNNISEFVGNESETNDWIQSEQVEGLSFKYDVNNQTLYLKVKNLWYCQIISNQDGPVSGAINMDHSLMM